MLRIKGFGDNGDEAATMSSDTYTPPPEEPSAELQALIARESAASAADIPSSATAVAVQKEMATVAPASVTGYNTPTLKDTSIPSTPSSSGVADAMSKLLATSVAGAVTVGASLFTTKLLQQQQQSLQPKPVIKYTSAGVPITSTSTGMFSNLNLSSILPFVLIGGVVVSIMMFLKKDKHAVAAPYYPPQSYQPPPNPYYELPEPKKEIKEEPKTPEKKALEGYHARYYRN